MIFDHINPDKLRVVNEAPTVLKSSIRLTIALIVPHGFKIWSRDISQAFLQSTDPTDPLRRTVYVRPSREENVLERIGAEQWSLLYAIKPRYGLSDAPGYWWQIPSLEREDLEMKPSVLDPCLLYNKRQRPQEIPRKWTKPLEVEMRSFPPLRSKSLKGLNASRARVLFCFNLTVLG